MDNYDLVVIGSGPAGYRAAVLAALRGLKVAIVERGDWGGCCLNRGCVPKKDWYHSARLLDASRAFARRGIAGTLALDLHTAWAHQEEVVATVQRSYLDYMKRLGVAALTGHARFTGPHTLAVDGESRREVAGAHVIIATGASAHIPAGVAPVSGRVLTTDMLFDEPPPAGARVGILGGGVIATEFAFILRAFGREVRWFARRPPLARSRFSPQALTALKAALTASGVAPTAGEVASVRTSAGGVRVTLATGTEEEVDWLLLATGRRPDAGDLALDKAGLAAEVDGRLRVDEHLRTDAAHIYGIGDCVGGPMTANQALADAACAVRNIVDGARCARDPLRVPEVVYSAVELARVGLNEDLAEERELEPAVGFAAFEASPRALGEDDTRGFVRLIADMDSGELLGGEVVGAEAGELIHLLALAPRHEALAWLADGAFNHPARAEEVLNAVETLGAKWGLGARLYGGASATKGDKGMT